MNDKMCPLLIAAGHNNGACMGVKCAWCVGYWNYAENRQVRRCALNALATDVFEIASNGLPER